MKRTFPVLSVLLLSLFVASPAFAADVGKGVAAYDRGDYAAALKEFRPLAKKGDAKAQFMLGFMYNKGEGVTQDFKTALKWYTLAAEQGNADAQTMLGLMYNQGKGVIQDYVHTHMWFNIAASSGHKNAVKNRDSVAEQMSRSQIEKAQNLARQCVKKNYKGC